MIRRSRLVVVLAIPTAVTLAGLAAVTVATPQAPPQRHHLPRSSNGFLTVGLCDGETAVEVKGVKEGQALGADQARAVADTLMAEWRRKNPGASWDGPTLLAEGPRPRSPRLATKGSEPAPPTQPTTSPASTPGVSTSGETSSLGAHRAPSAEIAHTQAGNTYGNFSERDRMIWAASTESFVRRGKQIFHDVGELGGTTGISCDMCHPDAANTHPETYPKFQVQLGRVALLRDMINWCVENPVRGKALPDSDDRMRALEAYIYAQRRGVALEPGKH